VNHTIIIASALLLLGCEMQKPSQPATPQSPAATASLANAGTATTSENDTQAPTAVEQKPVAEPQAVPADANAISQSETIAEVAVAQADEITADSSPQPTEPIALEMFVRDAAETNLKLMEGGYGTRERPVVINSGAVPNYVTFEPVIEHEGEYTLSATFAAQNPRPFSVIVNEEVVLANVGDKVTKGLGPGDEEKVLLGKLTLNEGTNRVTLKWPDGYPCSHLSSISLDE